MNQFDVFGPGSHRSGCTCQLCSGTGYVFGEDSDNKGYQKRLQKSFNDAQLELVKRRKRIERLEFALEKIASADITNPFLYARKTLNEVNNAEKSG
ncbi:MAG: hypothetical protein JAY90_20125 [Candidatus Thiodiazotropha lotti]|nr:hypothetical protein [Candidatus Thiodiazotropha lotti]